MLQPPVRKSIRFAEAPARGKSILQHAPNSPGAAAYRALARTLLEPGVVAGSAELMAEGPDPLGKRALYWMPVEPEAVAAATAPADGGPGPTGPAAQLDPRPPPRPAGGQARPVLRRPRRPASPGGTGPP